MPTSRWELQHQINTEFMLGAGPVLRLKEIEVDYKVVQRPIMVVDPADSEAGCEWGLFIGGLHEQKLHISHLSGIFGEAYEGDDWESMGQSSWRQVFDIAAEYGVQRVYLESNLKSAAAACRRYVAKTGTSVVVEEYRARRSKKTRIPELLEQPINNRMVSANPGVMKDKENTRQMSKLRWDKLPKPNDRIDVLAGAVEILVEEPHLFAVGDRPDFEQTAVPKSFARIAGISRNPYARLRR